MKCISVLLFITIFGGIWRSGRPTCVLESDFGFTLNCAFKKSGLFRVRNLGGVKAHIGLGFSVGDELGFKESLSNTEQNRRRSAQGSKLEAQLFQAQQNAKKTNSIIVRSTLPIASLEAISNKQLVDSLASGAVQGTTRRSSLIPNVLPPFKPIPRAEEIPKTIPKKSFVSQPSFIGKLSTNTPDSKVMAVVAIPKTQVEAQSKISTIENTFLADRTLASPINNEFLPGPIPIHSSNSIQALLAANNVSEEALELAYIKGQHTLTRKKTTAVTMTTYRPNTSKYFNSVGQVMNAPKEYYPVGYDKNFDDNFAARVELPETSFYCGDQKHFPGLYADEDLGCMVFHVCALTDDGLIMKSFLCPESTLFDQTILKCNWWFYVDCKNSKKLYDSNIPISKSYQLMKALTFFSAYKKDALSSSSSSSTPKSIEKD